MILHLCFIRRWALCNGVLKCSIEILVLVADYSDGIMSQEVGKYETSKEDSKFSGGRGETRVHHHHHHHHHRSISKLIDDVRRWQDEVRKIRKDLEEARAVQAEQVCQQKKLTGMMELVQAAITVDDSMKIQLANHWRRMFIVRLH